MGLLALLFAITSAEAASGLADTRAGPWLDLHGGLGVSAAGAGLGADGSLGVWAGPYDPDYALGRYWGLGIGARVVPGVDAPYDLLAAAEIRRGVDLLIGGGHVFAATGWDLGRQAPLAEVGLGAKARVRPTGRFVGWELRLRGGAVFDERITGEAGLTIGVAFAAPWRRSRDEAR